MFLSLCQNTLRRTRTAVSSVCLVTVARRKAVCPSPNFDPVSTLYGEVYGQLPSPLRASPLALSWLAAARMECTTDETYTSEIDCRLYVSLQKFILSLLCTEKKSMTNFRVDVRRTRPRLIVGCVFHAGNLFRVDLVQRRSL